MACLMVTTFPSFTRPAPLGSGQQAVNLSDRTLQFTGNGAPQAFQFTPVRVPNGSTFLGASLSIETAVDPQQGAGNVSLTDPNSSTTLWTWPGGYGWNGNPSSLWLSADNSTSYRNLILPSEAKYLSARTSVMSTSGALTGNYLIQALLGGASIFSRSGAQAFLSPAPLPWGQLSPGISAVGLGEESDGEVLLGVGSTVGNLTLYQYLPGQNATMVYSAILSAPFPVGSVSLSVMPNAPNLAVFATSGSYVYVLEQNSLGAWSTNVLTIPNAPGVPSPTLTTLTLVHYENGYPAIVVGTTNGRLYVWNWSTSFGSIGFQNPAQLLADTPWPVTAMASDSHLGQPAEIAVSGQGGLQFWNVTTLVVHLQQNLSIGPGVSFTSLAFNSTGSMVVGSGTDGSLYPFLGPDWTSSSRISVSNVSIEGLYFDPFAANNTVAIDTSGNGVYVIFRLGESDQTTDFLGTLPSPDEVGPVRMGPVFGSFEPDVIVPVGNELWASISNLVFNSTTVSNFLSDIVQAIRSTPTSTDPSGNIWSNLSVGLTTHGGGVSMWGTYVTYNLTTNVSVSGLVSADLRPVSGPLPISLTFTAGTGGILHVVATMRWSTPSSASSTWLNSIAHFFSSPWFFELVVAMMIVGLTVVSIGTLSYHRSRKERLAKKSPNQNVKASQRNHPKGAESFPPQ